MEQPGIDLPETPRPDAHRPEALRNPETLVREGPPRAAGLAPCLLALGTLLLLTLPGAGHAQEGWTQPQPWTFESQFHDFRIVPVAEGLEDPWSVAFLPSGDLLITEKPGRLRIVRDGALEPDPVPGTPEVRYAGQGGLLEVMLHPDFESNRLLYLSFSKMNEDGSEGTTAVVRGTFDGERLSEVEEVFVADAWRGAGSHYGGKLAFDRDGYLFVSIGDRGANPLSGPRGEHPAQDPSNHIGTIVRIHDDGRVPDDNPFVGDPDALPEVWSYGHRNPQGLVTDPETGRVWSTEHGPQGGDELNLIEPGRNYGWPVIGYGVQYGGTPIHEGTHRDGMEQPVQFWTPSIATSGLMLYRGDRFPDWQGHLFVGGLDGQQMARLPIVEGDDGLQVGRMERPPLLYGFGRIRDIRESPDGFIYIVIDDRRQGRDTPVVRLEPRD
jgi:aldose sugar dehydrogenase